MVLTMLQIISHLPIARENLEITWRVTRFVIGAQVQRFVSVRCWFSHGLTQTALQLAKDRSYGTADKENGEQVSVPADLT